MRRLPGPRTSLPTGPAGTPAYLFTTSGSTGEPKIVLGTQEGLSHFVAWQRDTFGIGVGDRSGHLTGAGFDVVLRDLLTPLASGATVCVPPEEVMAPSRVIAWLQTARVTMTHVVPSLADLWLTVSRTPLPHLRLTFFAGEPLKEQLVTRWREVAVAGRVVNLYGPTETTLAKVWDEVTDPVAGVQPVGLPLPGAQIYAFRNDAPCPPGETGEMVIRTPYRTLGYLRDGAPRTTGFTRNPYRPDDPGDLLYHTGDRGRLRPDGRWELLGRIDDQIKINGVRVSCADIEALLGLHPSVRRAVVVPSRDGDTVRLAAMVTPSAGATSWQLRDHLRDHLPDAALPAFIERTDTIPLLPNGKVDRTEVVARSRRRTTGSTESGTTVERTVAQLWQELLNLSGIGPHDDFFALGGHSLLAAEMLLRLRERTGAAPSLADVYEARTVQRLAHVLETAAAPSRIVPVPRRFVAARTGECR